MVLVERVFCLCILLVVTIFFVVSFQYEMISSISGVGAGFLPSITAFILLFLVIYYVLKVFRNKSTSANSNDTFTREIVIRQIILIISLFSCLFLVQILGMIITIGLFLIGTLHFLEKVSWVKSIVISTVITLCVFFLFTQWLNVKLPTGVMF
ncbi:MAG TPA: tripartite tricarboxylate transporter TctB family protein [Candidatus Avamphibacillus sp.]|nr:tripartite tricarboxylate transporter TctB family protein [Candidatus Avamphibacillus sp.]